jgi:hypothetical protein
VLTNGDEAGVRAKLARELAENPPLELVIEVARTVPEPLAVDAAAAGIELVPLNEIHDAPNRCRMKLFRPREGKERLCAFFYKRSNLAWSRDRYSYGSVEFRPEQLAPADVRVWLAWLCSGLSPERRPETLRRAYLYTVPD